jgi:hypothetical protein
MEMLTMFTDEIRSLLQDGVARPCDGTMIFP